jgi:hypothetical protein
MLTTVEKSVVSAIFISAGSALAMMHIKRGVVRQSPVNGIPIAEYIHGLSLSYIAFLTSADHARAHCPL